MSKLENKTNKDTILIIGGIVVTAILIISFLGIRLYYSKPQIKITHLDVVPPRGKDVPVEINEGGEFNLYYAMNFNTILDDVELFFDYPKGCLILDNQKNPLLFDLRNKELNKEISLFSRFIVPEDIDSACLYRELKITLIATGNNNLRAEKEVSIEINKNVSQSPYCRECLATCGG